MERQKAKKPKFRQLKRIGTMALAATIALSVPAVSNVVGKVSPLSQTVVSAAEETNLMVNVRSQFTVNHNDSDEHWTHGFHNDAEIKVDGPEFDVTDLIYVVKFPEELSHLLEDSYVTDYLFGNVTNFGSAQSPFMVTGFAIDEDGETITLNKDGHKPYEHISINKETNSIEFDFNSYYTENKLEPYVRQDVLGDYYFNNLGFNTPIIVPDARMLNNGTYEFKSAFVRGTSVDLDNVPNAYSENLVVDYSTDPVPEPEPEPEVDMTALEAALVEAEGYDSEDYTDDSFAALATAAEAALTVFENGEATQEEVDEAVANLQGAIDRLVEVEEPAPEPEPEVDTSDLETVVANADDFDADDYTAESFALFTAAFDAAEEVLANENATQEEVDGALAELQVAIDGLVVFEEPTPEPEVEKEVLAGLVEDASGYDADDYTVESFALFTAAFEAAETVLANEDATQEEVDGALAELQVAIDGLEEVVVEPTPEPEKDVTIIDDSDNKEEGEGNLLPKTATSSFNMMLGGFIALLVGAGSLLLSKRKRKLN